MHHDISQGRYRFDHDPPFSRVVDEDVSPLDQPDLVKCEPRYGALMSAEQRERYFLMVFRGLDDHHRGKGGEEQQQQQQQKSHGEVQGWRESGTSLGSEAGISHYHDLSHAVASHLMSMSMSMSMARTVLKLDATATTLAEETGVDMGVDMDVDMDVDVDVSEILFAFYKADHHIHQHYLSRCSVVSLCRNVEELHALRRWMWKVSSTSTPLASDGTLSLENNNHTIQLENSRHQKNSSSHRLRLARRWGWPGDHPSMTYQVALWRRAWRERQLRVDAARVKWAQIVEERRKERERLVVELRQFSRELWGIGQVQVQAQEVYGGSAGSDEVD